MHRSMLAFVVSLLCFSLPASGADRGALFKVSGHGHTMLLFGTMHVGLPEFYPLEPRIAAAVAGASTLALEFDPMVDPAAIMRAMQAHAMLAPGSPTLQDLPPPLRQRLQRALAKAGIDPDSVARWKPWLVATRLALAEFALQGYRTDLSVDLRLAQLARAGKVPVIGLETIAGQLGMFGRAVALPGRKHQADRNGQAAHRSAPDRRCLA